MKILFIFLLLCSVNYVQAQSEQLRVIILDDNIKKSDFPQDVKFDSRKKKMSFSIYDRDAKLEQLKLSTYATKMDELGRDLLFMNLKNLSLEELTSAYPQIPIKDLEYAKTHFNR